MKRLLAIGLLLTTSIFLPLQEVMAATTTVTGIVPLDISGVSGSSITSSGAIIIWTTNGDSTSQVFYDTVSHPADDDASDYASSTTLDTDLVSNHSVALSGLTAAKTYYYRVQSVMSGIGSATSDEYTFTTSGGGGGGGGGGFGGGGGGGGGGGVAGPGETNLTLYLNSDGVFVMSCYAYSDDKLASLYFIKGVQALDQDGRGLKKVAIKPLAADIPAPPTGANMYSLPYEFSPAGSNFNPPATLTLAYGPAALPQGFNPANLVIMVWNPTDKQWEAVAGAAVDTASHTVSVPVSHFSLYALFGSAKTARPAAVAMSSLSVSPGEANTGETVTISAMVANSGDLSGDYTVTLKINGQEVESQTVNVAGNGSTTVRFTYVPQAAGAYTVEVNGRQSAFNVWVAGPDDPEFVLKSLAVFPYESTYGEEAVISIVAENNGDAAVTQTVVFKIDDVVVSSQEISLAPHSQKTVEYITSGCEPGTRSVDVNGIKATFNVRPLLIPPSKIDINWYLIGLIIFGVTALTSTIGFRLKSRTQYIPPVPPPVRRRFQS